MSNWSSQKIQAADRQYIWHPYGPASSETQVLAIASADGVRLNLADGRQLIDGKAAWWSAIHGYNHPVLNSAVQEQLGKVSHVMFDGLSHQPAAKLAQLLVTLTPPSLDRVFFSDSGSVAVEVAIKMAVQYWLSKGQPQKQKLVALQSGYHGDTFGAMSVSDPNTGIHQSLGGMLNEQIFAPAPSCKFSDDCEDRDIASMTQILSEQHHEIAGVIVEPVVQASGGMRFYSPQYLVKLRALCDAFDVLLIFDEIATGFGRTGKMFALEHAQVEPDILCLGKALTGGYMTLAATLCNRDVSNAISEGEPAAFMHGSTFMANPLACAVAIASIELLLSQPWQRSIKRLNIELATGLAPAMKLPNVADVRTIGAIGVIELDQAVDRDQVQAMLVDKGVWVRPFAKLIYVMPAYIMSSEDVTALTAAMVSVVADIAAG
ncbi:UNVERIFIED_CONTAM: hypothetical protein GTU68_034822 [Idotea baltica]|nr:hypothetical protein [Idotea baltica]